LSLLKEVLTKRGDLTPGQQQRYQTIADYLDKKSALATAKVLTLAEAARVCGRLGAALAIAELRVLKRKSADVTGSTNGIGLTIASSLAAAGANVLRTAR
jgi:hypothetical protein